jgi:hypothetical protein
MQHTPPFRIVWSVVYIILVLQQGISRQDLQNQFCGLLERQITLGIKNLGSGFEYGYLILSPTTYIAIELCVLLNFSSFISPS